MIVSLIDGKQDTARFPRPDITRLPYLNKFHVGGQIVDSGDS